MPTEKNTWEIEQMKARIGEVYDVAKKNAEKIHDLEIFKTSTVDKLIIVFDKLEELQEGDRWIKRVFITALVGAIVSAVFSLVMWGITK